MVWGLAMHLTLHLVFIQIPRNIPPNVVFILVFSQVMKRTEHKADAERFRVHSSPLIYWKFQHLNRRTKVKSTGILAR